MDIMTLAMSKAVIIDLAKYGLILEHMSMSSDTSIFADITKAINSGRMVYIGTNNNFALVTGYQTDNTGNVVGVTCHTTMVNNGENAIIGFDAVLALNSGATVVMVAENKIGTIL